MTVCKDFRRRKFATALFSLAKKEKYKETKQNKEINKNKTKEKKNPESSVIAK